MTRRTALAAGVAAVAGAAGLGGALWQSRRREAEPAAQVWSLALDTPSGGRLRLADFRGKALLLNFWATWCPPCVRELPLLDTFHREQRARGWEVVGLAVDNRDPVVAFLAQRPVGFAIGLAGMAGVDLSRNLGNAGGALPFTVVFDRAGGLIERKLGVIEPHDLQRWARIGG